MKSGNNNRVFWSFISLIGATLFLSGYYFGLTKNSLSQDAYSDGDTIQSEKMQSPISSKNQTILASSKETKKAMIVVESGKSETASFLPPIKDLLTSARLESNPIKRAAAFAKALENLNQGNISQTLKEFELLPMGFENMQEYKMLLYAWSQFDPLAAIDYCKGRASGIGAGFATAGVLEGWANLDPEAAREWVEDPENAGMAKIYNFGLVRGWANRDLEGATDYVMGLEGGEEVGKLVGILTEKHNREGGFSQASSWADTLPNAKLKEGAFMNLSRSFARDRPEDVAGWLEYHPNEKYSDKAFENLGKRWSETDPESSIDYFSNLPDGKSQEVGIKSSISNWARQDPLAAGEWLNGREPGSQLDSALAAYASTVATKDGGAAMEWAISITDEKLQQTTIRKVGQDWYRQDKESVEAWLPDSGLSEGEQKSIRTPPKKNWWQSLSQ